MRKLCGGLSRLTPLLALAARARAAEGGDRMVLVADSRRFSGCEAWWANLYNDNHACFAVLTVVIIVALGVIMGRLTDLAMKRVGIDLKNRARRGD